LRLAVRQAPLVRLAREVAGRTKSSTKRLRQQLLSSDLLGATASPFEAPLLCGETPKVQSSASDASSAVTVTAQRRRFSVVARRFALSTMGLLGGLGLLIPRAARAAAAAAAAPAAAPKVYSGPLWVPACLWLSLFAFSSSLHAAEISITTLYPWKVREFAEEEGPSSPFAYLNEDITRVLTTVLVLTTVSQVVSTVLFTAVVAQLPQVTLGQATAGLTFFTLFFGELLPKALGVSNAEMVARSTVPVISVLAVFFSPFALCMKFVINNILRTFGVKSDNNGKVSEEELRLIVMGAKQSGGIEKEEAKMVEGVLDLQDMRVSEVMRPRINVEALEVNATLTDFLEMVNTTKYSRIPVYEGEIDHIVGVVIARDLLIYAMQSDIRNITKISELMEPTYFVPESMRVQSVLEEMRRRRVHMAIVVDEYGGTAGIVTLEDILEEVVGEIYDEGDEEESELEESHITLLEDGRYELKGVADLEGVCTALGMSLSTRDSKDSNSDRNSNGDSGDNDQRSRRSGGDARFEFGTISGFLCDQAGEIPLVGDVLLVDSYAFTVLEADERRVLVLHAEKVAEPVDELTGDEGSFLNKIRRKAQSWNADCEEETEVCLPETLPMG